MTIEVPPRRVYIAGPMTHYPHFNFPAFIEAAERLRSMGYDVVSPAELDNARDRKRAMASPDGAPIHYTRGKTWGDFLARDVKLLADGGIEAVFVLPGWQNSSGARLETFVAAGIKHLPIYCVPCSFSGDLDLARVSAHALEAAWAERKPAEGNDHP